MRTALSVDEARTAHRVVSMVAVLHQMDAETICGPSQDASVMEARRDVCWVLRRSGFTSPKIGTVLDRDHTSVLYLLKTTEEPSVECLNF